MKNSFNKIIKGYEAFREKYALGNASVMQSLSLYGQKPEIMVVACCDARVDPALLLQCDPGDLFVTRNVANIVPPYKKDDFHHGTSAALEFGICYLNIKHLILLGHSQCGGINALLNSADSSSNDFINNWVAIIKEGNVIPANSDVKIGSKNHDYYAKLALQKSHQNCLSFPWIQERVSQQKLIIHLWFFDIQQGQIFSYCHREKAYYPLDSSAAKDNFFEQTC